MINVAPSILAADPLHLYDEIIRMTEAGCDYLHVDVMDAHFVPNLSFSPSVVKAIKDAFPGLRQDVHLMMDNPENYIDAFADAGAWGITIHAEIPGDAAACLRRIREKGCSAGLSVKPGTPAGDIRPLLPLADLVLVMTVEPGFGGQSFQPAMLDKLRFLRSIGYTGLLEADGGVRMSNLPLLRDAGLDVAVMGTALFREQDTAAAIRAVHRL